jgi:hypothetical protein
MPPLPDLDHLRLPPSPTTLRPRRSRPPHHRPQSAFLKGPIPWDWLDRAGRLPGKALAVGLVLWQKAGLSNTCTVKICQARLDDLGLREASTRRGIRSLQDAGLIAVVSSAGRGLKISLLDLPARSRVVKDSAVEGGTNSNRGGDPLQDSVLDEASSL